MRRIDPEMLDVTSISGSILLIITDLFMFGDILDYQLVMVMRVVVCYHVVSWSVIIILPDHTVLQSRRQPSLFIC
jgi:hypothetical protein